MSAICGIYRQGGQPISPDNLKKQMSALVHCGPDGNGIWRSGSVGLGHQMMHITSESLGEELPYRSREIPELAITADVRLDNRDELFTLLDISPTEQRTIPDSHLILAAYNKWGRDCPAHLLGDFVFVIWDGNNQTLFCARDHLGVRPFYYHSTTRLFVFASDIQGVVAHPDVPRQLSDFAVATHLRDGIIEPKNITFFRSVKKLPPAHTLIIDTHGIQIQSFWTFNNCTPIRLPSLDAYAEMLSDLLYKAVSCRLRSAYPVGGHLSGGLDSSSISVLAARILRERGQSFPTFNWMHPIQPGDDPNDPEWADSRNVCEFAGLTCENIEITSEYLANLLWRDISLHHPVDLLYEPLVHQAAKRHGIRVLLSGWGGDELITFNGEGYYAELFWNWQWKKLFHAVRLRGKYIQPNESFNKKLRRWLGTLYRKLFLPSLPDLLYALIEREWLTTSYADCATPTFANYIRQQKPIARETLRERIGLHAQQLALLQYGHLPRRMEAWANIGSQDQIVYAYPLLDKRIVEFSLGIPADLYVQDGYSRYLYRYAMKGILPDKIRWRGIKNEPRRINRLLSISKEAAQIWFSQARDRGWENLSNRYIDASALVKYKLKSESLDDATKTHTVLINSIQALVAGSGWKGTSGSNNGYRS